MRELSVVYVIIGLNIFKGRGFLFVYFFFFRMELEV